MNPQNIIAKGMNAISMRNMVLAGNLNSKFGILITVLKKKYTKFAINVAIPAPSSPIFGIKTIFKTKKEAIYCKETCNWF